jgi:hypothetical protein
LGYQQCQLKKTDISKIISITIIWVWLLIIFNQLTWLIAWEHFINCRYSESLRSKCFFFSFVYCQPYHSTNKILKCWQICSVLLQKVISVMNTEKLWNQKYCKFITDIWGMWTNPTTRWTLTPLPHRHENGQKAIFPYILDPFILLACRGSKRSQRRFRLETVRDLIQMGQRVPWPQTTHG